MNTIYIWDIHWSFNFENFINKYNDGNTKFISLGDIFDRGSDSYKNYLIIKQLYSQGLYDMILWNHDLFFIFWIGFSEKYNWFLLDYIKDSPFYSEYISFWKNALELLMYNWWEYTLNSIFEKRNWYYSYMVSSISEKEQIDRVNEIAKFLFQFQISKIDSNWNLLIHGGLPILKDGSCLSLMIDNSMTKNSKELLDKINLKFKQLDLTFINLLTLSDIPKSFEWIYSEQNIINLMNKEGYLHNPDYILRLNNDNKFELGRDFILTWFDNTIYFQYDKTVEWIKRELKFLNAKALICGHWWNKIPSEWFNNINSDYWKHLLTQNETVIRLDRSYRQVHWDYWNFWYIIFNNDNNKYIEVWDVWEILN